MRTEPNIFFLILDFRMVFKHLSWQEPLHKHIVEIHLYYKELQTDGQWEQQYFTLMKFCRGKEPNHTEEGISLSHMSYPVWLVKEILMNFEIFIFFFFMVIYLKFRSMLGGKLTWLTQTKSNGLIFRWINSSEMSPSLVFIFTAAGLRALIGALSKGNMYSCSVSTWLL